MTLFPAVNELVYDQFDSNLRIVPEDFLFVVSSFFLDQDEN